MRAGRDADGHTASEPVDHAASQRHEQQLGVLADKDGRLPFDQVAPGTSSVHSSSLGTNAMSAG